MRLEHDKAADAVYDHLRDVPYDHGEDLDAERRVDFGADGQPRGIELLNVSQGVDVRDLPSGAQVASVLQKLGTPLLTRSA